MATKYRFAKLGQRLKLPLPGGSGGEYGKAGKILGALAMGPALGPVNPLSMDPEVLGARGSVKNPGLSVDEAKQQTLGEWRESAASEAAAEQARVDAKRQATADRLEQDEEARKKLRAAATGGFASTVLTGPGGLTSRGAASRRLYGS